MGNTTQKSLVPLIGHAVYLYLKYEPYYSDDGIHRFGIPMIVLGTEEDDIYKITFDHHKTHMLKNGSPFDYTVYTTERKTPLTPDDLRDLHDPFDKSLTINVKDGKTVILEKKLIETGFIVKTVTPFDERTYSGFWGKMGYPDNPEQKYGYKMTDTNDNEYELSYIRDILILLHEYNGDLLSDGDIEEGNPSDAF